MHAQGRRTRFSPLLLLLLVTGLTETHAQIQTSVPFLDGFIQTNTIPCPPQSYVVTGTSISSDVIVTAPTGFQVSVDQITWVTPPSSITIDQNGPTTIPPTTIYVRLNTPTLGTHTGNIAHTSTDSPSLMLPVSGVRSEKSPTTTDLLSSPNPSVVGQTVTLTASVSSPLPGTPTGTVTFSDGPTPLGTVSLNISATAILNTSTLTFGPHSLTATYNSDATFEGSTSGTLSQDVLGTTTTLIASDNNPAVAGEPVQFTATVSSPFPGTITGSVTFFDGAGSLGPAVLTGGTAVLSTSALSTGSHSITAAYSGDLAFAPSTSPPLTQAVQAATTVGLSSNHNPSVSGQSVTLTATVSSVTPGTITGTVSFFDGLNPVGTPVAVTGGTAELVTSFAASGGPHTFVATYNGDTQFGGSTSPGLLQTVNKAPTNVVVTGVPNPSALGQAVTFTAAVAATPPGAGVPAGTVTFTIDGAPADTVAMAGGTASMVTSSLALGVHAVTGTYSGDADYLPVLSSVYSDSVDPVITATTGPHGSISPSGAVLAPYAGDITFFMTPLPGYRVDTVFVDTTPTDSTTRYTFTHVTADHTIRATFRLDVSPKFLTVTPETLIAKDPAKGKLLKAVKFGKNLFPNWANLRDEVVAQGGFAPGRSESDSAGGLRIGISFMQRMNPGDPAKPNWKPIKDSAAVHGWVRIGKYNFKKSVGASPTAIPKTLENKVYLHVGPARGLDYTGNPGDPKRKLFVKEQKKLDPKKTSNRLFAELLALKFNIAASALGKTPPGLGELLFDRDGNPVDEFSLVGIAARTDTMMTYWRTYTQADYDSVYSAIHDINRAFAGPVDTASFNVGGLALNGSVALSAVPFLKLPTGFSPVRYEPTTTEREPDVEFEDEECEEAAVPVAAKLYQNYPNPFNPATTIAFRLLEDSRVTVQVYDALGRHVAELMRDAEVEEGYNELQFDATGLSSGVYFCRIDVQGTGDPAVRLMLVNKMVVVK